MKVSRVIGNDQQYVLIITFGKYGRCQIFRNSKENMEVFQRDLFRMNERMQYYIAGLMELLAEYSKQQHILIERFPEMLLHKFPRRERNSVAEAIQNSIAENDWDVFLVQYWQRLLWMGCEWSREDVERYRRDDTDMYKKDKKLIMLELPLQYKRVINRFLNQGELETLLYLQLLMETGIRSADVWQIRAKDIRGRKVFAQNRKYGEGLYYFNGNRLPRISKRTERIAQILAERQGYFFSKPARYYQERIRKEWEQPEFSLHLLRRYRVDI